MKFIARALAFFAAAMAPAALPAAAAADDAAGARVIVTYRAESTLRQPLALRGRPLPLHAAQLGPRIGLALTDRWVLGAHTQSVAARGLSAEALARRLRALPEVAAAEPVRRRRASEVPNDPFYGADQPAISPTVGQWYLRMPDQTLIAATNAESGWNLGTGSGAITVAVLDTGVRFDHPDFVKANGSRKLFAGYDFITRTGTAADGDGMDADASDPGDWSVSGDTCGAGRSSWHGTQTAGLIGAASNNGIGMASMGREVMVLPVRVLGKCGGWDDDIQAGMLWAAGLSTDSRLPTNTHPAKVLNMSLGSEGACGTYQAVVDQITAAGAVVVAAAGNGISGGGIVVDAPANCRGVISVAGARHTGTKVGYSNLGPDVTISAPAGNCVNVITGTPCLYPILTTINMGAQSPEANAYSDSFDASVGTSFAAPQVAGAVALMLSRNPTLTPAQIRSALQAGARPFPTSLPGINLPQCQAPSKTVPQDECYCTTSTCGAGLLDVGNSMALVVPSLRSPVASIVPTPAAPAPGDTVTLDSAGSGAFGERSIVTYAWSISSGSAVASLSGATNGPLATLVTNAIGSVTVQLLVVDNGGGTHTRSLTIDVRPPGSPAQPENGSGGGGALGAGWLAALAAAAAFIGRGRTKPRSPAA